MHPTIINVIGLRFFFQIYNIVSVENKHLLFCLYNHFEDFALLLLSYRCIVTKMICGSSSRCRGLVCSM